MSIAHRSTVRTLFIWIAGIAAVAMVTYYLYGLVVRIRLDQAAQRAAQQELARLTEMDQPARSADIDRYYQLPNGENDSSQRWLDATKGITGRQFQQATRNVPLFGAADEPLAIPPPGAPWPGKKRAEQFLAAYAANLTAIHEVARRNEFARFPAEFATGPQVPLPHLEAIRVACKMLVLQAHVRAHRGDVVGVVQSVEAIFRASRSLEYEPAFISQLVRITCTNMGLHLTRELLPYVQFSDVQLASLQKVVRSIDHRPCLRRALIGERAWNIDGFRNPARLTGKDSMDFRKPAEQLAARNFDLIFYLQLMERLIVATETDWPEPLTVSRQVDLEASQAPRLRSLLTQAYMPATTMIFLSAGRGTAASVMIDVLISVKRFRQSTGKLPTDLAELINRFPRMQTIDPMDGRQIRLIVGKEIVRVYSVGDNLIDDGGVGERIGEQGERFRALDAVFELPLRKN